MLYYYSTVVLFPSGTLNTVSPAGLSAGQVDGRRRCYIPSSSADNYPNISKGSWSFLCLPAHGSGSRLHHRRQVIPEPGQPMSDVHGR
jgi:hypothetical protein